MTRVYLIRHAEAEGNIYRRAQGQYDGAVSAKGLRQIAALAERFRTERIDALYTSDLSRTRATAGDTAVSGLGPRGATRCQNDGTQENCDVLFHFITFGFKVSPVARPLRDEAAFHLRENN